MSICDSPLFRVIGYRVVVASLITPTAFPSVLTWKYNFTLTYILVSFLSRFVFFEKLCSGYC